MRGRKPTPTALKLLHGNPGHRPMRAEMEPAPKLEIPECPPFLSDNARREWFRIAEEYYKLGLLTNLDRTVLAAYCSIYARWARAERRIESLYSKHEKAKGKDQKRIYGEICVWEGRLNRALTQLRPYYGELGLSAAARTRIRVKDPQMELPGISSPEATKTGTDDESPFERARRMAGE